MTATNRNQPHGAVSACETHLSQLFFTPDRVYKLLKPVDTPFVSFVDREDRIVAATQEFDLNYRLAPDVYLGVADVEENGALVDRMIVMKRLPEDRQLHRLLDGPAGGGCLRDAAKLIASLHAAEPPITGDAAYMAGPESVLDRWQENFEALAPLAGTVLDEGEYRTVIELVENYIGGRRLLFEERIRQGWIRDGHGDLRAEHVFCLPEGPRLIDCLAFRPDYRIGDVLNDIAFLAMDLHRLAGPEASASFVHHYCEFSNEHHSSTLAHHYVAYRAHVRAKVAAVRLAQGDERAVEEMRDYHRLAWQHLHVGQVRLVLVGGGVGVGKSTVAEKVAQRTGAVWLRSDEIRKASLPAETQGSMAADQPVEVSYDSDSLDQVYGEMLRQAEALLARGETVILDATWSVEQRRQWARQLAERTMVKLTEIRLEAPLDLACQRIAQRLTIGEDPSDATPEVARQFADRFETWSQARTVRTDQPVADSVDEACHIILGHDRGHRRDVLSRPVVVDGSVLLSYESIRFYLSRAATLMPALYDNGGT